MRIRSRGGWDDQVGKPKPLVPRKQSVLTHDAFRSGFCYRLVGQPTRKRESQRSRDSGSVSHDRRSFESPRSAVKGQRPSDFKIENPEISLSASRPHAPPGLAAIGRGGSAPGVLRAQTDARCDVPAAQMTSAARQRDHNPEAVR